LTKPQEGLVQTKILGNWIIIGILLVSFASGCSSPGQVQKHDVKPVTPVELPSGNGWWSVRFRMNWPPDTEPAWHLDLYLAHQVIKPLLEKNKPDIYLWRFHRRAKRDLAGRQFTFYFYSSPQTAQQIFDALQSNPIIDDTLSAGVIDDNDPTSMIPVIKIGPLQSKKLGHTSLPASVKCG
jgi:hypothetical protein